MEFLRGLRQLWRHRLFRRLFAVRVAAQSADAVFQVALASYVLFSPERQPTAGAIAAVFAVTLLPFSVLGPFASVLLDRISRRQVLLVTELIRGAVGLGLAGLVAGGIAGGGREVVFYGGVLIAMSLNRFLLAALSASLPHTVAPSEYLVANSVMPTVGPLSVIVGGGLGTGVRLALTDQAAHTADAVLFALATGGFLISAGLSLRIPRARLGPDQSQRTRPADVVRGLADTGAHLRRRRVAGLGLLMIAAHRIPYGVVMVASILVFRNYFHHRDEVAAAIAELGTLGFVTGVGFVLAAVVTPWVRHRAGARVWMIGCFVLSAVLQMFPGATYTRAGIMIAAFACGLLAQGIKISVDTFVQAHVDDEFKGRTFVIYDMIFNVSLVAAAGIGALILPANGKSVPLLAVISVCYLVAGLIFAAVSKELNLNRGDESLRAVPDPGPVRGG